MSLFERLNNKRYDLQEAIDDKGNITPEPGDIAKEKSILRNIKKKSNKTFASGSFDPANQETKFVKNEKKKNLSKEISQRRTVQDRKQQLFNRQYDAYDDGDLGNPTQTKSSTATQTKTVKQSEVSKQAKDFTKKINKKRTGGFENVTGEGQVKYPKTRKDLIAKRAEYGIDSKGNISDAGVKRYAQKTKELSSGSNLPVTPTQKELDLAKKRAVGGTPIKNKAGKVIGTTTGKYGGKLPQVRGKNQPSLADVKAKIDAKNPTYTSPITGGKLPVKQVRDPDLKRMSPADRATYKEIKRTTPKGGIPKWMKDFDKQYPDKSKLGSFKNPPPTVLKVVKPDLANPTGFKPVDTKTKEGAKIFKKQVTGSQLVAKTPAQLEPIPKPKSKNVFSKIKAYVKGIGPKVRNKLKDPGAPEFRTYTRPDGSRVFTRNKLSKNIVKRTFQKIPKRGKVGAILAGGLLTVSAINALLPKGKKSNTGDGNRRALLPFGGNKPGDYKPVPIKLSLTSARKNKSGDYVKTPQLPVNNNPNVQNFVNRTAQAKRNT